MNWTLVQNATRGCQSCLPLYQKKTMQTRTNAGTGLVTCSKKARPKSSRRAWVSLRVCSVFECGCGQVVADIIKKTISWKIQSHLWQFWIQLWQFCHGPSSHPISFHRGSQPKKRLWRLQQPHGCNKNASWRILPKKTSKNLYCVGSSHCQGQLEQEWNSDYFLGLVYIFLLVSSFWERKFRTMPVKQMPFLAIFQVSTCEDELKSLLSEPHTTCWRPAKKRTDGKRKDHLWFMAIFFLWIFLGI